MDASGDIHTSRWHDHKTPTEHITGWGTGAGDFMYDAEGFAARSWLGVVSHGVDAPEGSREGE